jgi:hypothetical protein
MVGFFEVLLELIKLGPKSFPFVFDIIKLFHDIGLGSETILLDDCFSFALRQVDIDSLIVSHHPSTTTTTT